MPEWTDKEGYGVLFYTKPEDRKTQQSPGYTGYIMLEMDYRAGEKLYIGAWQKETTRGTKMYTLREDNWKKKRDMANDAERKPSTPKPVRTEREVEPNYNKTKSADWDEEVPF